jgi:hypothetical protein
VDDLKGNGGSGRCPGFSGDTSCAYICDKLGGHTIRRTVLCGLRQEISDSKAVKLMRHVAEKVKNYLVRRTAIEQYLILALLFLPVDSVLYYSEINKDGLIGGLLLITFRSFLDSALIFVLWIGVEKGFHKIHGQRKPEGKPEENPGQ